MDDFLYIAHDAKRRKIGVHARDSHTLIVGEPSAGKTKTMDAFILAALQQSVHNLVIIIDPKETGFTAWKGVARVRLYQDLETFSNVFEALIQEHQRRTSVMSEMGIENMPETMHRIYVLVDELPSLVSDTAIITKKASQSIITNMTQLLRLSRQTGIQFFCATQSAEGSNIIKANLRGLYANRILMKCSNESEAEMLLNTSAEELRLEAMIAGEAWIKTANLDLIRCWIDYFPSEKLRKIVATLPIGAPDFSFMEKRNL